MRTVFSVLVAACVAAGFGAGEAVAAECEEAYSADVLLEDLANVEAAAQSGQQGDSIKTATKMERGLPCLDEKLAPMLVGRAYRSMAAGFLVGGNETKARGWFRTSIEIDPNFEFGLGEFGMDHPVRAVFDELRAAGQGTEVAVDGKVFGPGKHYLDGRGLDAPVAVPGRPHLLQRIDGGIKGWLIDGNAFPAEVLVDAGGPVAAGDGGKAPKDKPTKDKAPKAPKPDKAGSTASSGGGNVVRVRPKEKTPLMIAGGVVLAGAGAMFGAAIAERQNFNGITDSEDDLRRSQRTTNALYFGSIGVAALGAGTLTWGIIVDADVRGPVLRGRF